MSTINQKVFRPYVFMLVALPVMIVFFFNIVVNFYARQQAEEDLQEVYVRVSVGRQMDLNSMIELANLTDTTEIVLYDTEGKISQLATRVDTFMNEEIANLASAKLEGAEVGEIVSFSANGEQYYAMEVNVRLPTMVSMGKVVYISFGHFADGFVFTANAILMVISVLLTACFLIFSKKVVNSITRPIEEITKSLGQMDGDAMVLLNEEQSCVELKNLTCEMNSMSRRIDNYTRQQKSFLHNASHELRTPLMNIQGYAEGLGHGVFTNTSQVSDIIVKETHRLTNLVDELLTLSRIENYDTSHLLTVHTMDTLMEELLMQTKGYATKQEKTIQLQLAEDVYCLVNERLMYELVGNVLSNCIKYATTTVRVTLKKEEGNAIIAIGDDGCGISPTDLPHIFEKFYKGEGGNFGLGLSIAQSAVHRMGGTITVESGGEGSDFTIILPLITE